MDLIPFEVTDLHLIAALVIKILIVAFAWWKIKFLTALAGGLDDEKRKLKAEIQTHLDNEAVLKREISELNSLMTDREREILALNESNEDFEKETVNAQHECLRLEDRIKALKGDNEDLQKKLNSQKAHHGKQKKKIVTLQDQIDDLDKANNILEKCLNCAVKAGYFVWDGKYHKAIKITAPSQKKQAQLAIENFTEKQQN